VQKGLIIYILVVIILFIFVCRELFFTKKVEPDEMEKYYHKSVDKKTGLILYTYKRAVLLISILFMLVTLLLYFLDQIIS